MTTSPTPADRSGGKPLLELEGVRTGYGPIEVLKGIDLVVHPGEIVTVLGANGAGKSTTLMTICGINRCTKGRILFAGEAIHDLEPHHIVRRGISQVPEGRRIFPRLTVLENLEMGAFQRREDTSIGDDLEKIFATFPIMKERRKQLGGTLSGGEQQMLAISRALMARPKLLLLDEPSLGLAPMFVVKIFDIIRDINRQGTTILLVEQNANMALHLAHRGYVLETGRIVIQDTAKNLVNHEQVKKSYLGG